MIDEPAVSNSRRQEILDAAAAVFAEKGYHGTGMRDVADRLGMKAGSLYFHLASKDAALEEVCAMGMQISLRSARTAVAAGGDMATRVRAMIASQVREFAEHGDYISVYIHERRHLSPEALARVTGISNEFRILIDQIFEEGRANGELAAGISPRAARYGLVGQLRNLTQLYIEGPIRDFDAVAAEITEMFLSGTLNA